MAIQDELDLLAAVFEGPFQLPLWSSFLDRLRGRVRASYASIIFRPPDRPPNSPVEIFSGTQSPPELQRLYRDEIYKLDPIPYFQLREGRVYALHEVLDRSNPEHSRYLNELLIPSGMKCIRLIRVTEPSGTSAWLSIARDKPDFSAADGSLLNMIGPHLRQALRNYVAIERERFRANVSSEAMQRLNFGWISLDAKGRVIEASPHAERLLRHCSAIRKGRYDRLTASSPSLDCDLTATIKSFADNPDTRPRAFHISPDPWVDMLVVPAQPRSESTGPQPVAIAYLQGDNRSTADRHEQIAELFGLLPSEAKLALALSRGLTIAEAATYLGLTVETARNYSKKIYAKMGARGQPDLIRFILASVLALA